ncbi:MAG: MbnP family copper-binding protein [Cognaticolwellia sp.]
MLSKKYYLLFAILLSLVSVVSYLVKASSAREQHMGVQLLWKNGELDCQSTFNTDNNKDAWFIEQVQFFISDIEFQSEDSVWQGAKLVKTPFQTHDTALLGTNCREVEQKKHAANAGNWQVEFDSDVVIAGSKRMRFTLGVPFERNHLNPISQESPLNIPSMFWVWQTGHKFIRLEMASKNAQWLFHLGSTGCKSASVMRSPQQPCRYPNTFTFELPITKTIDNNLTLTLDLAQLLAKVELSPLTNCQSEQDITSCQQLFSNLLLNKQNTDKTNNNPIFNLANIMPTTKVMTVE